MAKRRVKAPTCPYCGDEAGLVTGRQIYPRRQDLWQKPFWRCGPCGAYCGCHPGSKRPLGFPANAELRRARMLLHEKRIDPLWLTAESCGEYQFDPNDRKAVVMIRSTARRRIYNYLADRLGIDPKESHTAMFTIDQCREAWIYLTDVNYPTIRAWAKARKAVEVPTDATAQ
jgi:hypothetical protein